MPRNRPPLRRWESHLAYPIIDTGDGGLESAARQHADPARAVSDNGCSAHGGAGAALAELASSILDDGLHGCGPGAQGVADAVSGRVGAWPVPQTKDLEARAGAQPMVAAEPPSSVE